MSEVYLISHTPEPEKLIAMAAKNCYSSLKLKDLIEKVENEDVTKFINYLFEVGHLSPFEHASFTFGYTGVSRSMLAQITRHRISSFSVRSQRYVNHDIFDYYVPNSIRNSRFIDRYVDLTSQIQEFYNEMKDEIPNDDRRYILPESCSTQIVHTCNARELLHIFRLRCCNLASEEIRNVVDKMLCLVRDVAPTIFMKAGPKCFVDGRCNEGRRSCGKLSEVKDKYSDLKRTIIIE